MLLTELVELIDWVWTTGGPTGGHRIGGANEDEEGNIAEAGDQAPKKQQKRKKYLLPRDARLPRVKVTYPLDLVLAHPFDLLQDYSLVLRLTHFLGLLPAHPLDLFLTHLPDLLLSFLLDLFLTHSLDLLRTHRLDRFRNGTSNAKYPSNTSSLGGPFIRAIDRWQLLREVRWWND